MHNYRMLAHFPQQLIVCAILRLLSPTTTIYDLGNPLPVGVIDTLTLQFLASLQRK